MKNIYRIAAIIALGNIMQPVWAQDQAAAQAAPAAQVAAPVVTAAPASTITIKRDTPVQLMATKEINSGDSNAGAGFRLRLNEAITVDGKVVVPVGAWAIGEVTSSKESGGLGKSGQMHTRLKFLELRGVEIPLQGEMAIKGQGAGSAGAAILFSGVAGLFHRGNNAKIKAGELVHGFVSEDVILEISGDTLRRVYPGK